MRWVALVAISGWLSACDECKQSISDYCHGSCPTYDERVAGRSTGRCATCPGEPPPCVWEMDVWACGEFRAVREGDGYGGSVEYYDRSGKLIGASSGSDAYEANSCHGYSYGIDLVGDCERPVSRVCLVMPQ